MTESSCMLKRLGPTSVMVGIGVLMLAGNLVPVSPATAATVATGATSSHKCGHAELQISRGHRGAAGGNYVATFRIRNVSAKECVVKGHPHVHFLSSSGAAMRTRERAGGSYSFSRGPDKNIQLMPRAVASYSMAPPSSSESNCPNKAVAERVKLKHVKGPLHVKAPFPYCNHGKVTVSNIVRGKSGPPPPGVN